MRTLLRAVTIAVTLGLLSGMTAGASAAQSGSQISYTHEQGYAIMQALIARNVIGDFRAPDCVRFGVNPLYLSYMDIWRAVDTIKTIMETKDWQKFQHQKKASVT